MLLQVTMDIHILKIGFLLLTKIMQTTQKFTIQTLTHGQPYPQLMHQLNLIPITILAQIPLKLEILYSLGLVKRVVKFWI